MRVLVAGCGWLGTAVARALVARGDQAIGVRRDPGAAAALARAGVEPLALDLAAPGAGERLPPADAIVACQAASGDGVDAYRRAYVEVNRVLLDHAARHGARAVVYTGSTGVFGQRDGSEVDERTAPAPASPAAEVLVEAERLFTERAAGGAPATVVRLSGLYGPGRTGLVDRVRSGAMALGPGDDAWTNWCHLDDAVAFVLAALDRGTPGAVYHGSDAAPATRREVVTWLAARLGMEPARRADGGPPASRAGANRRISSAWTREALGVTLRFPSFREGLSGLLEPRP